MLDSPVGCQTQASVARQRGDGASEKMREDICTYGAGLQYRVSGGQQTESHVVDARNDVHQQQRYTSQCYERRVDYQIEDPTENNTPSSR